MKYRGIIFDLNGVLVDDMVYHREAWRQLAGRHGTPAFSDEEWKSLQGRSTKDLLPRLLGMNLSSAQLVALEKEKDSLYRQIVNASAHRLSLALGAEQLLDALAARHIPRAIATSCNPDDMAFFSLHLGLHRWFDSDDIVCNDGILLSKPAPDVYLEAACRIHQPPNVCVAAEDSPAGIVAAAAAGIGKIFGLGPGERHADLRAAGAHETIEHLNAIDLQVFVGAF